MDNSFPPPQNGKQKMFKHAGRDFKHACQKGAVSVSESSVLRFVVTNVRKQMRCLPDQKVTIFRWRKAAKHYLPVKRCNVTFCFWKRTNLTTNFLRAD